MIKLWRRLIEPVFVAIDARRVLEIGAESGLSTRALLRYLCERGGHLDSIDPAPDFDADVLQAEFAGTLSFHRDLSLNVLPRLARFDVAMIDGDHNWFTVFHELQAIERIHGPEAALQPLILIHDTGWPYGRRDLYYDPDTIPAQYRHPYARLGMLPNRSGLAEQGGMNMQLCNALQEGGPRNGVATAVDDYLQQSARAFVRVDLPVYHGLTMLATRARLDRHPELGVLFDELAPTPRVRTLMELNEHLRCVDLIYLQVTNRKLATVESRLAALEGKSSGAGAPAGTPS